MRERIKNVILIQGVVIIYTFSGIMSKKASASGGNIVKFLSFFGLELVMLAVYALLWQQMLKRFELSAAYANRSTALLWSMLWAAVFFGEPVSVRNIVGALLVLFGIVVINTD